MNIRLISVLATILAASAQLFAVTPLSDKELSAALKENVYRSAGGLNVYDYPKNAEYTKAPNGYKPFYVSHLGRHGSRYQIVEKNNIYTKSIAIMDSLRKAGALTASGDSLLYELKIMGKAHDGNSGILTENGGMEHRGIAERLYIREQGLFDQPDRKTVTCTSTSVPRCIQSMANFGTQLQKLNPGLDLTYHVGLYSPTSEKPHDGYKPEIEISPIIKHATDSLVAIMDMSSLIGRIFKEGVNIPRQQKFLHQLFTCLSDAGCMDETIDPLRFFTEKELLQLMRIQNIRTCGSYGGYYPYAEQQILKDNNKKRVWDIILQADAAIEGNGHCADLRFAHDGNIGPLNASLGFYTDIKDIPIADLWRYWPSWRNICMGTNVQIVFYRNADGDVLVKLLRNEQEMILPDLKPATGCFYKWSDLRTYWLSRIGFHSELPSYCKAHLKKKAKEIRDLQNTESDGFYFVTDWHFPENGGPSAAAIEYLEGAAGRRMVVFGGDAEANVKHLADGIYPYVQSALQIRGTAPIYLLRGNHDFTLNTKDYKKSLSQPATAKLIRGLSSYGTVYNSEDPYSDYGYLDHPESRIRYIFLDTTDSVGNENRIFYGISPRQLRWIIENGIFKCPEDWKIIVMTHVPLTPDQTKFDNVTVAGRCFDALNKHEKFEYDGQTYDFSTRKDIEPIMIISGHRHRNAVSNIYSVPQFLADCDVNRKPETRKPGTVSEMSFKYVSIGRDRKEVRIVNIGHEQ